MYDCLNDDNFLIYVAQRYNNPQCRSTEEFLEDLNRLKYIKKLITRYIENKDLQERLILNHIIILNNVFGPDILCKILYFKMKEEMKYVVPFLVMLNILPSKLYNIKNEKIINTDEISLDMAIVNKLRRLTRNAENN